MVKDLGGVVKQKTVVYADASAALVIIQRRGVGAIRHLDTRLLWVQEQAVKDLVECQKVAGSINPADLGTKALEAEAIERHLANYRFRQLRGRPHIAPGQTKWGPQNHEDELANSEAHTSGREGAQGVPRAQRPQGSNRSRLEESGGGQGKKVVDCGALNLWGGERRSGPPGQSVRHHLQQSAGPGVNKRGGVGGGGVYRVGVAQQSN